MDFQPKKSVAGGCVSLVWERNLGALLNSRFGRCFNGSKLLKGAWSAPACVFPHPLAKLLSCPSSGCLLSMTRSALGSDSAAWGGIERRCIWILQDLKSLLSGPFSSKWCGTLLVLSKAILDFMFHSHIHLFIKRVSHCTGPTYFRLNNLITSLQLLQATQSMTFKSNGRMILMAAILGHSTH